MKPDPIILRSADAFQKWSDKHRAQVWNMIERLGKGEVTNKEVRDVLREEKKALSAISKQVLGFKTGPGSQVRPAHPERDLPKAPKSTRCTSAYAR
ncbi:MAG TPA: hypothetical protein VK692_00930 [Chthoniobacterales bacterium]|jgi:hypothetical protein|nr:hypothetical protein [Chthoniobacterales bacterium]